jgi:CheY-like chemotaxis protein
MQGDKDQPPLVLVMDEDVRVRRLMQLALQEDGCRVDVAIDGLDAVERVSESGLEYDVILLDLNMPVMDGRTCFRELREVSHVPVVIVSAYGAEEACRELGAEGAISKPFDPLILTDKVRELATQRRRPAPA